MNIGELLKNIAIAARVKEPSSWAGAAVVIQGAGMVFPQYAVILTAIAGLLGGVAVLVPERGAAAVPAAVPGADAGAVGPFHAGP